MGVVGLNTAVVLLQLLGLLLLLCLKNPIEWLGCLLPGTSACTTPPCLALCAVRSSVLAALVEHAVKSSATATFAASHAGCVPPPPACCPLWPCRGWLALTSLPTHRHPCILASPHRCCLPDMHDDAVLLMCWRAVTLCVPHLCPHVPALPLCSQGCGWARSLWAMRGPTIWGTMAAGGAPAAPPSPPTASPERSTSGGGSPTAAAGCRSTRWAGTLGRVGGGRVVPGCRCCRCWCCCMELQAAHQARRPAAPGRGKGAAAACAAHSMDV